MAVVAGLTALLWLVHGPPHTGYDATWALAWGDELGSGTLPQLGSSPAAPTPHPLANLLGALVAPLGESAAPTAFELVVVVALAAIALVCFRIGTLFAWPVGAAFAVIVLTRPHLLHEAAIASTDVVFLALVLGALLAVAKDPGRGWPGLALLAAAGLLRPEAWLLSVLYGAYLLVMRRAPRRLPIVALALLAPAVWMLADLVVTGNALFSLEGTRELAAQLDRPRGFLLAVVTLPGRLERVIGETVLWLSLAGWVVALWTVPERALLPSVVVVLGIAGYLVLGAADLPLLVRYTVLPGVVLTLFAAVLIFGWVGFPERRGRIAWMAAGIVAVIAFVASLPADVRSFTADSRRSAASDAAQRDLERLVASPAAQAAMADCPPVRVHDFRVRPFVWYWADVPPREIGGGVVGEGRRGAYVTPGPGADPTSNAARRAFHKEEEPEPGLLRPPPGARVAARTGAWRLDIVGCA